MPEATPRGAFLPKCNGRNKAEYHESRLEWCPSIIFSVLGRQRQNCHIFKASLVYVRSSRLGRTMCLKTSNKGEYKGKLLYSPYQNPEGVPLGRSLHQGLWKYWPLPQATVEATKSWLQDLPTLWLIFRLRWEAMVSVFTGSYNNNSPLQAQAFSSSKRFINVS